MSIRHVLYAAVLAVGPFFNANMVLGATESPLGGAKDLDSFTSVTTAAASKAEAEVQIRRLKNLLVSSPQSHGDQIFERLEKLQKNLRGQK